MNVLDRLLKEDDTNNNMQQQELQSDYEYDPEMELISSGLSDGGYEEEAISDIVSIVQKAKAQAKEEEDVELGAKIDGIQDEEGMMEEDLASKLDGNPEGDLSETPLSDGVIDEKDIVEDEKEYHDRQEDFQDKQDVGLASEEETTADQAMNTVEHMKDEDVLMSLKEGEEDKEEKSDDEDDDEEHKS